MTAHTLPARRRSERPPLKPALLALLISAVVTGAGCAVAVLLAPESIRTPLAYGAGAAAVLLCAAAVTVTRQSQRAQLLREDIADLEHESARLAERTVPALVERLRDGSSAETALADVPPPPLEAHRQVLRTVADEFGRSEGGRAAAMAACASAAGRMQALATGMLADLREMEHRHSDETVLGDLLHLDHRTAQAGRLADSIAVLTGARSGRRWAKPIVMESIMRGAMGRIAGYQRVRLHSTTGVAVAGHAAEGVMHALAELLDNAANFSPPTAEVHVYVEEVPAGVIITIEDSGLVMSDFALRRAERAVSGEPLDLTSLSGTRLGLAVVGCLARKHGLTVSFRPSARGGTGALVRIPQELITRPRTGEALPGRQRTPAP
ncbi:ATP-binding protein, partial [Streptomyces sparsus]